MSAVIVCTNCGEGYVARRWVERGWCRKKECRKAANIEYLHRSLGLAKVRPVDLRQAILRRVKALEVVNDPLDVGGFAKGTVFIQEHWERMLFNFSFTPGTILKDSQNRLYEFRVKDMEVEYA